jgi:hypothetical protein
MPQHFFYFWYIYLLHLLHPPQQGSFMEMDWRGTVLEWHSGPGGCKISIFPLSHIKVHVHSPSLPSVNHHQSQHYLLFTAIHSLLLVPAACLCHSLFIPGSGIDQNLLEIIPIALELTWNPSGSAPLTRYPYYIPCLLNLHSITSSHFYPY